MARKLTGQAVPISIDTLSDSPLMDVGRRVLDTEGNEYIYVGASGVSAGAPVKIVAGNTSFCKVSTDENHVLGVAVTDFPSTGIKYGLVGSRGTHPALIPSGTAQDAMMVGGAGALKAATGVPSLIAQALAAATTPGNSLKDVYIF